MTPTHLTSPTTATGHGVINRYYTDGTQNVSPTIKPRSTMARNERRRAVGPEAARVRGGKLLRGVRTRCKGATTCITVA